MNDKLWKGEGIKMKKFIAEPEFWAFFPECEIGVLVMESIHNEIPEDNSSYAKIKDLLQDANREAAKFLTDQVLSQNKVVAVWREAFMKFKTKKGARSSIEALLRRVDKGNEVGHINPLVDLYNAISLTYGLPCGMEDLDCIQGDLKLKITTGGDDFLALGDEAPDPTLPGELCYLDDLGAVCRCWNWRDGQRTMLTEKTSRAIAVIESVDPGRHQDLLEAIHELAAWAEETGVAKVTLKTIVDREHPEVMLY
jgi:DNA/RNA-binding domain of Phe-tRNA-synthetase-like protein